MFKKLVAWSFALCMPVLGLAKTPADQQLIAILNNFQSMTANFNQTVYDNNHNPLQKSQGYMILHRPGNFRWEIKKPMQQLFVTDGKTLWTYDIALEQATEQPLDNKTQISPAQLLTGSPEVLAQNFVITLTNNNPQTFKLTPKGVNNMFEWVELTFNQQRLNKMVLMDTLNQQTHLTFSDVILNPRLKDDLFSFKAPAGVDMIRDMNDNN